MSCPGLPPSAKLELHLKIRFLGEKSKSDSFPLAPGLNLLSLSYTSESGAGGGKKKKIILIPSDKAIGAAWFQNSGIRAVKKCIYFPGNKTQHQWEHLPSVMLGLF